MSSLEEDRSESPPSNRRSPSLPSAASIAIGRGVSRSKSSDDPPPGGGGRASLSGSRSSAHTRSTHGSRRSAASLAGLQHLQSPMGDHSTRSRSTRDSSSHRRSSAVSASSQSERASRTSIGDGSSHRSTRTSTKQRAPASPGSLLGRRVGSNNSLASLAEAGGDLDTSIRIGNRTKNQSTGSLTNLIGPSSSPASSNPYGNLNHQWDRNSRSSLSTASAHTLGGAHKLPRRIMSTGGGQYRLGLGDVLSAANILQGQSHAGEHADGGTNMNLTRPSLFSTTSTQMARQFLEETDGSDTKPLQSERGPSPGHDLADFNESMGSHGSHGKAPVTHAMASISDLEWNPEAQRYQQDEWRKFHREDSRTQASANANATSRNFPQRKDLREVDQSVNLMDQSLVELMAPSTSSDHNRTGRYQPNLGKSQKSKRRTGRDAAPKDGSASTFSGFFSQASSSLVEIWLDERSTDSSKKRRKRRGRKKSRRDGLRERTCCQDLFCSPMTIILLIGALLGAFIAWRTGAFWTNTYGPIDSTTPPPAADGDPFGALLLSLNVSTSADLQNVKSSQYLAWHWITKIVDDPTLLGIQKPKDAAELDIVMVQAYVLAVLYFETNNVDYNTSMQSPYHHSTWTDNTNWMRPTPICKWHGLECEGSTHIVHLNMSQNNLLGRIPRELKMLSDLRTLDFANCMMVGSLPDDLWPHLVQLEFLWLNQNLFTGTVPSTFGNMTNLKSLRLYKNQLHGQLPAHLNKMTSLLELSLHQNKIDGTIPYLAHLSSLERLELQDNKLAKHIPFELFRFHQLKELRVERNYLTGTIPPEIQTMRALRILAVDNNLLSGTLNDKFDHFDYLEELRLQANNFVGTIPPTFGHLTLLKTLLLDHNEMTGAIPTELALMTAIKEIHLFENHFMGELPSEICSLKREHELGSFKLDCANKATGCNEEEACCDKCL